MSDPSEVTLQERLLNSFIGIQQPFSFNSGYIFIL